MPPIQWHPAIYQAFRADFVKYGNALDFVIEFQLNTAPLKIDLVIIKVLRKLELTERIAQIFRIINIVEYKSPKDTPTIRDYYKTQAYARLYASHKRKRLPKMSVTIVASRYPEALFRDLRKEFETRKFANGIYYVIGESCLTQIVVLNELDDDECFWIQNLRSSIPKENLIRIVEDIAEHKTPADLDMYGNVISEANPQIIQELKMTKGSAIDAFMEECGFAERVRCQTTAKFILFQLKKRFKSVPKKVEDAITAYSDFTALESLLQCAIDCDSINDFKKSLVQK